MSANSRFLNLDTDGSLSANSDDRIPSQKAVKTALNSKQDTLVSGTNIKTVNGNSLLGSGNIDIGGGVSADGTTIEDNSNVFTTVGVKDQKTSNANKMWTGTKAEYDAIATKDANTFYHITDDEPNTVAYAKADLSNLTHGLENTICTTPATTTSTATSAKPAVVVENYSNGTSWYRVYSDGWCEQGGTASFTNYVTTIYLSKTYKDTNYSLLLTPWGWPSTPSEWIAGGAKYTDSFEIRSTTAYEMTGAWYTAGYLAIE